MKQYIENNKQQMYQMLKELCEIPAPSHFEHKRAEYCKNWLEQAGAEGVYIDEALNVIFPYCCEGSDEITVFVAHTDTVFPDTEPMPYYDDGKRIHSPGVADDTASVVVLLLMAKYFIENKIKPQNGIMFVCNSCEEGLGDLKGTRRLFEDYGSRIKQFITFDSDLYAIDDQCVGSHRYEVEAFTQGGHSYEEFGNKNAIYVLSEIVSKIYQTNVPEKEGTRTTYNVGTISGGTSVNTIAQNAKMLCEYRSNDKDCLLYMQKRFEEIFDELKTDDVTIKVKKVGDRPCSSTPQSKIDDLKKIVVPVVERVINKKVSFKSSSTDCNIPLSLGIPALCVGVNVHEGIHTREEWVDKESMISGLEVAISLGKALTEE